jgi:hypothetical protein
MLEERFKRTTAAAAADEVVQLADRKLNDLTPSGKVELVKGMFFADPLAAGYHLNPAYLLPAAYGDNRMFGIGPTPLLDRWVIPSTSTGFCSNSISTS